MNKEILRQYADACRLVEETEKELRKLEKQLEVVHDSVHGSDADFPYTDKHFHISGIEYRKREERRIRAEQKLLAERMEETGQLKLQVEQFMRECPPRIQRIIYMRYFDGNSWEKTAELLGGRVTGEGVRMEFNRFLKKK